MYDLNQAVRQWKETMTRGGVQTAEDLQELESHLRDEISSLHGSGLSEEEAFLVAARRLGSPAALAAESSKTNHLGLWRYRIYWMAGGVLLYVFLRWAKGTLAALLQIILGAAGFGATGQGVGLLAINVLFVVAVVTLIVKISRRGVPLRIRPRSSSNRGDKVKLILIFCAVAVAAGFLHGLCGLLASRVLLSIRDQNSAVFTWCYMISAYPFGILPLLTIILLIGKREWSRVETLWENA